MIYLWSTNPSRLGSRLIQWGGGRDVSSHFSKYYPEKNLVVESRLETGVRAISFEDWCMEGNVVVRAYVPKFEETDEELFDMDSLILGRQYDRPAVLYMALYTLVRRLVTPILTLSRNRWGRAEDYYCVEIVATHAEPLRKLGVDTNVRWDIMYPDELYEYLRDQLRR